MKNLFTPISIGIVVLVTIAQLFIPIALDRTIFSYFVFYLAIPARLLFILKAHKLFHNWVVPLAMDGGAFILSLIFFMSAFYKQSFPLSIWGIIVCVLMEVVITALYAYEEYTFVYVETEIVTYEAD